MKRELKTKRRSNIIDKIEGAVSEGVGEGEISHETGEQIFELLGTTGIKAWEDVVKQRWEEYQQDRDIKKMTTSLMELKEDINTEKEEPVNNRTIPGELKLVGAVFINDVADIRTQLGA